MADTRLRVVDLIDDLLTIDGGWWTVDNIVHRLQRHRDPVIKALNGHPHMFEHRTHPNDPKGVAKQWRSRR